MAKLQQKPYGQEAFIALKNRKKEYEAQHASYMAKIAELQSEMDSYKKSIKLTEGALLELSDAADQMQRHNEDLLNI